MAPKLADQGLHNKCFSYPSAHEQLRRPAKLPCLVFDHIGWPDLTLGTGNAGLEALYQMLDSGKVWIKLSASTAGKCPVF